MEQKSSQIEEDDNACDDLCNEVENLSMDEKNDLIMNELRNQKLFELCSSKKKLDLDLIKKFIEKGADQNFKTSKGGYTPLHEAAHSQKIEVVQILLQSKANPNILNDDKRPPLRWAAYYGNMEIGKELLDCGAGSTLNAGDYEGWTPLHTASSVGREPFVKLLLQHGADPNCITKTGQTPLHLAAQKGNVLIIQMLLNYGAQWNIKDNNGDTALHVASFNHREEAIEAFFNHIDSLRSSEKLLEILCNSEVSFKINSLAFLCCLKKIHHKSGSKIPKPLIFHVLLHHWKQKNPKHFYTHMLDMGIDSKQIIKNYIQELNKRGKTAIDRALSSFARTNGSISIKGLLNRHLNN